MSLIFQPCNLKMMTAPHQSQFSKWNFLASIRSKTKNHLPTEAWEGSEQLKTYLNVYPRKAETEKNLTRLEPVITMSPEHILVEILKFEFNLGSNWKMRCCIGQTHSRADF